MDLPHRAVLYIFAGFPGAGKSTLARRVAREFNSAYLRIDTIEQALRDLCGIDVHGEGYGLCYEIAKDNLALGRSVVADSCNPISMTRNRWETVARESGAGYLHIEIVCSDEQEHRRRIRDRTSSIPGLKLPTWEEIMAREFHAWDRARIVLDTAGKSEAQAMEELLRRVATASPAAGDI